MPYLAATQGLRRKLDTHAFTDFQFGMKCIKGVAICDIERQMVQSDNVPTVKRNDGGGILGLPEGNHREAVSQKNGWIIRDLTHESEPKRVEEKGSCPAQIGNCQANVMSALGNGILGHDSYRPQNSWFRTANLV